MDVYNKTGAPMEMVILVALSAMSTAMRGFAIRTPDGRLMPTSLYCMGMGPPVCGKSAAMREFYKPIRDFDSGLAERREAISGGTSNPALRDVLQLDATWSSLIEALDGRCHGLTVADDDCFDQLKGNFLKGRGRLNRIFDGSDKESLIRRDVKPLAAYSPSVGICFLTQPEIFAEHQRATRRVDRTCGLATRFLYARTESKRRAALPHLPTPCLDEVQALITWCLEQGLQRKLDGNTDRIELCLSPEAESRWNQIREEIDQRRDTDFYEVQDSADRATEKTWRVAALLHLFYCLMVPRDFSSPIPPIPPITREAIEAAWAIVEWSLSQFHQAFPPPKPKPPKISRVWARQIEEMRRARGHLYAHMRRSGSETMPWEVAQELSFLTVHKFKTVVAHMKSMKEIEVSEGKNPIIRFTSLFFAEVGYAQSIGAEMTAV